MGTVAEVNVDLQDKLENFEGFLSVIKKTDWKKHIKSKNMNQYSSMTENMLSKDMLVKQTHDNKPNK